MKPVKHGWSKVPRARGSATALLFIRCPTRYKQAVKPLPRALGFVFILIGIPFAGLGIVFLHQTRVSDQNIERSANWPSQTVRILEVELRTNRSEKSSSPTFEVRARYTYEVEGQEYTSDRVSWNWGADSDEAWHRAKFEQLRHALEADGAFKAFVNPDDPSEAVLFPEARPLVRYVMYGVGGIFTVVGALFGFGGLLALFGGNTERRLRRQFPQEPWKWRPDWAAGFARCDTGRRARSALAFAVIWTAVTGIAGLAALLGGQKIDWAPVLIIALFFGLGVWFLQRAVRALRIAARYGSAQFLMTSMPGVVGGKLAGVVRVFDFVEPEDHYAIELRCERIIRRGKSTRRRTEWSGHLVLDPKKLSARKDGVQLPVLFAIPYGLPSTARGVEWILTVRAKQPGLDLELSFEVPVYQTAESRPDVSVDMAPIRPFLKENVAE